MDKFLQNNTVIKGIALLLAIMLWMIVRIDDQPNSPVTQPTGEITVDNIKVEALYDEELYSVVEMEDTVQVVLTGRRALLNLNQLRTDPYRLYVDLTNLEAGRHRVPVQYEGFPSEIDVEVIPNFINVVLEEKELKAFNVVIELTGQPREGFEVGKPVVNPEEVHLIAPSSVLDQVALVKGFVSVANIDKQVTTNVNLKVYDQQGNEVNAEVSPETVEVNVPVSSPSKTIPLRLNIVNELPNGMSLGKIETNVREVQVFAPLSILDRLIDIPFTIDLAKIESSETRDVKIPLATDWIGTEPSNVTVEIEVGPTQTRTFDQVPIEVQGLGEDYDIQYINPETGSIDVSLSGYEARLQALRAEDIGVVIDVSNLTPGEHRVPIELELPEYMDVAQQNQTIMIRIIDKNEVQETNATNEENEGE